MGHFITFLILLGHGLVHILPAFKSKFFLLQHQICLFISVLRACSASRLISLRQFFTFNFPQVLSAFMEYFSKCVPQNTCMRIHQFLKNSNTSCPLYNTKNYTSPPKKLHNTDNHDDVINHLEPDILECKVKRPLGSITRNTASGGDGIPVELFQMLKDHAVKVLHSICQQIWKIQQWPQEQKRSVFIPIPKKGNVKGCSNYHTIAWYNCTAPSHNCISHASKVTDKILQARLQQYMNYEIPDIQAGFKKAEEPEMKSTTSVGSEKKQENSRKTTSASLTTLKPLTDWITINHGKFFKRWEYQTT